MSLWPLKLSAPAVPTPQRSCWRLVGFPAEVESRVYQLTPEKTRGEVSTTIRAEFTHVAVNEAIDPRLFQAVATQEIPPGPGPQPEAPQHAGREVSTGGKD